MLFPGVEEPIEPGKNTGGSLSSFEPGSPKSLVHDPGPGVSGIIQHGDIKAGKGAFEPNPRGIEYLSLYAEFFEGYTGASFHFRTAGVRADTEQVITNGEGLGSDGFAFRIAPVEELEFVEAGGQHLAEELAGFGIPSLVG